MDNIRSKGTVEVKCGKCGWFYWIGALDKSLPDGPFICFECEHPGEVPVKAKESQ